MVLVRTVLTGDGGMGLHTRVLHTPQSWQEMWRWGLWVGLHTEVIYCPEKRWVLVFTHWDALHYSLDRILGGGGRGAAYTLGCLDRRWGEGVAGQHWLLYVVIGGMCGIHIEVFYCPDNRRDGALQTGMLYSTVLTAYTLRCPTFLTEDRMGASYWR